MQNNDYKKIFELSSEAIILLDNNYDVIEVNRKINDWLGYSSEEIVKKNIIQIPFFEEKDSKKIKSKLENFEDNLKKNISFSVNLLTKNNGAKIGSLKIILPDITKNNSNTIVLIREVTRDEKCEIKVKKDLDQQELISKIAIELNSTENFEISMNKIITMLGSHLEISRVCVFEDVANKQVAKNTYKWVNKGQWMFSEKNDINYNETPSWKETVYKNGVLTTENIENLPSDIRNILKPREIKSILVFPMRIKKEPFGFIGFFESKKNKLWTMAEIELLRTSSNIISSSYQKRKAEEKLKEKLKELEKMNKLMLGREIRMVELKNNIKKLNQEKLNKISI